MLAHALFTRHGRLISLKKTDANHVGKATIKTLGESFPDGRQLEIVADPANPRKLRLLYWDGKSTEIASSFELDGKLYRPAALEERFISATRFPVGCSKPIGIEKLFASISTALRENVSLPQDDADRFSLFAISTWFSDLLSLNPPLVISSADVALGIVALQYLGCFCRRPLLLAIVGANAWRFAMRIHSTLLLHDAGLTRVDWRLLRASGHGSLKVIEANDVYEACFSRVLLSRHPLEDEFFDTSGALRVCLAPSQVETSGSTGHKLQQLADEFQPQLLAYRLYNIQMVQKYKFSSPELTPPTRAVAASLGACIASTPILTHRLLSLLKAQDDDVRAEKASAPESAVVEVLFGWLDGTEVSAKPNGILVKDLADSLNALLRSRGGICEYSPEEVGWMLKKLGLPKSRTAAGMQISFGPHTCRRIRDLAISFDVKLITRATQIGSGTETNDRDVCV
jgi:hypothetical protein